MKILDIFMEYKMYIKIINLINLMTEFKVYYEHVVVGQLLHVLYKP